jgi:hypothetical protein
VDERSVGSEGDSKHDRGDHDAQEEQQGSPGLIAVAEGDAGDPGPQTVASGEYSAVELSLALGDENLADVA